MMTSLRPKIYSEAKPGTRVVSHDYSFDEWYPDDQVTFDVAEKEKVNGVPRATLHLWIVPAKVQGKWQVSIETGERYDVSLRQRFQNVSGSADAGGRAARLTYASLRGDEIHFTVFDGAKRRNFSGTASDNTMQGTVELGAGRTARWTAKRL
jgi:hypothetical protein